MGPENWLGFQHIMGEEYDYTDKKIVWDCKVAKFCQEPGEHVAEYSSGFFHKINGFCPRIMKNQEKWRYIMRESTQVVGYQSPSQNFTISTECNVSLRIMIYLFFFFNKLPHSIT